MRARHKSRRPKSDQPVNLTEWRTRKQISLEAIAAKTKICRSYLEAIELGKFQRLPGGAYNVSYLRQYAQAIGFDVERLLADYRRASSPEPPAAPLRRPSRIWDWLRSFWTVMALPATRPKTRA